MEDDPHQVLEGTILSSYATKASTAYIYLRYEYPKSLERLQGAIDECYEAGYLGGNILDSEFSSRYLHSPWGGRLHLRRRNRSDRKPRRQAGMAADQAALPCRRRAVSQAHGRQQRGNDGLRDAHHRSGARVVQVDRNAGRSGKSPRPWQLRSEALSDQRPRQPPGSLRSSVGIAVPGTD
jgi:hypothetical protein